MPILASALEHELKTTTMKKLLILLISSVTLAGCQKDCQHGFGPEPGECSLTWASKYDKTWVGTAWCNGSDPNNVITSIEEETATRIRIEGSFYAELEQWNQLTIPNQTITVNGQNATVTGYGMYNNNGTLALRTITTVDNITSTCDFSLN